MTTTSDAHADRETTVYIVALERFEWWEVLAVYKTRERAERYVEQVKREEPELRNPGWGQDEITIKEYTVEDLYEQ